MVRFARLAGILLLTALLAAWPALAGPGTAYASDPLTLREQITDRTSAGVLGDTAEAQRAVDELRETTGYRLFVVFIDTFGGLSYEQWGDQTAELSRLGDADILLAVAVQQEDYTINTSDASGLTPGDLDRVENQIRSRLSAGDWSGAVVAGARGYQDAVAGSGGDDDVTSGASSAVGSPVVIFLVGLVIIAAIAMAVMHRRSRRTQDQGTGGRAPGRRPSPPDPYAGVSTQELRTRVGSALVGLDDDVRTSDQELRFAQAQFGLEQARSYQPALEQAREALQRAFTLQRQAEDAAGEQQRRALYIEILQVCEHGAKVLDEQARALAQLRQLERNVPQVLEELQQRAGELEARIPAAQAALTTLAVTYPEPVLATVAQAPDQAEQLIDAARKSIGEGRARVHAEDRGNAVSFAHTAEDALDQAGRLLDSVGSAGQDLQTAKGQLPEAISSITADLADAERFAPDDAAVAELRAEAQEAIRMAQQAGSKGDPIAAMQQIASAEAALDAALEPHRDADDTHQRVQANLQRQLAAAEVEVRWVDAYIESNRGGIGTEPRALLAEAKRALAQAHELKGTDPARAVDLADQALRQAKRAHNGALAAVRQWKGQHDGQGHTPYGPHGRSGGIDVGSLVLGGVLGSVLRGGTRAPHRGSTWGGGTWGGGSRGGSGGSWGGGPSTRGGSGGSFGGGRSGGGGRF